MLILILRTLISALWFHSAPDMRRIARDLDWSSHLILDQSAQNQWLVDYIIGIFGKLPNSECI